VACINVISDPMVMMSGRPRRAGSLLGYNSE
jgi:hypothetical protein